MCLRCRHEAIEAARLKQRALAVRAGTLACAIALVGALTAVGVSVARSRTPSRAVRVAQIGQTEAPGDSVTQAGSAVADGSVAPVAAASALPPVLPVGRTVLRDSAVVTISDSLVAVDFDQIMLRTRRPAKFESFLRSTLPAIYGAPVERALSALPEGSLASQGDLLTDLPRTGIRIPLDGNRVMMIWPETRPGEDGPLVIRFRVTVS